MKKGDVVAMVKSGISEDAIVLAIRKVMKDFDAAGAGGLQPSEKCGLLVFCRTR